jgi:hypothetical protein
MVTHWASRAISTGGKRGLGSPATELASEGQESAYLWWASGGQGVNRTLDTRIFSPLLYRLSYLPTVTAVGFAVAAAARTIIRILPLNPVQ